MYGPTCAKINFKNMIWNICPMGLILKIIKIDSKWIVHFVMKLFNSASASWLENCQQVSLHSKLGVQ